MKQYELKDRVVVITGSTGGLGQALAKALRAKGAKLALLDLNLDAVTKQAEELGPSNLARGWQVDVRSLESLSAPLPLRLRTLAVSTSPSPTLALVCSAHWPSWTPS